jgi:Neuraminidase (sialidase)
MNAATGFQGNLDIFFRRSSDNGKTWSERKTLNDDTGRSPKANHFDPGISVAPNGRIDIAWLDGRLSPVPPAGGTGTSEKGFQDVYYTSSSDQGDTWEKNLRVTDRSIDRSVGVWSNASIGSHHNLGVASTDAQVFVTWQDARNGNALTGAEDVYFSSIGVAGDVPAKADDDGVPRGVLFGVGILLGVGVATAVAAAFARRASAASA